VISGTNRKNSKCLLFAKEYVRSLKMLTDEEVALVALEELPQDWLSTDMYLSDQQSATIRDVQDKYIFPATKFLVVSSEYNGSYPGVLKLFIDTLSVREYPRNFKGKKIALAGVADGRAGNLRGMGHLAQVFNHVGGITMPAQMPYSGTKEMIKEGALADESALKLIATHAEQLVQF
ncbi:MAG: NAD(P)H-dependent oxidoreductase, partial [Bacteroidota bacterium]